MPGVDEQLLIDFAAYLIHKEEPYVRINFYGAVPTQQQLIHFLGIFAACAAGHKVPKLDIINLPEELKSELTAGTVSRVETLKPYAHLLGEEPPVDCTSCLAWLEGLFGESGAQSKTRGRVGTVEVTRG